MSITSANTIITIQAAGALVAPHVVQGYSADDIFTSGERIIAQTKMGLDGKKTSHYIPAIVPQAITLQADSPSNAAFQTIARAQISTKDTIPVSATVVFPSLGKKYSCINGTLVSYPALPDASDMVQPLTYNIEWEDVVEIPF